MKIMLTEETAKTAIKNLFRAIKIGAEAFALEQDPPIDGLDDFIDSTKFYLKDIEKACKQIRSDLENYFDEKE